ncbi:MAG: hypothetical protein COB93_02515 [Sneathiella sp.]|nr:MAG: hypothetical protein COB93_02515 [Sneathiella sp.]
MSEYKGIQKVVLSDDARAQELEIAAKALIARMEGESDQAICEAIKEAVYFEVEASEILAAIEAQRG